MTSRLTTADATPKLDIEELRVAFEAVCGDDFSASDLPEMTAVARQRLAQCETLKDEADVMFASMLRELLTLAGDHDGLNTVH